jgi:pilus assembly protein Flp/PilA
MLEKLQIMAIMFLGKPEDKDNERGATATEYGLLVGLIALVLVIAVGAFGTALSDFFDRIAAEVATWV